MQVLPQFHNIHVQITLPKTLAAQEKSHFDHMVVYMSIYVPHRNICDNGVKRFSTIFGNEKWIRKSQIKEQE
jgi:hypothetical protein